LEKAVKIVAALGDPPPNPRWNPASGLRPKFLVYYFFFTVITLNSSIVALKSLIVVEK